MKTLAALGIAGGFLFVARGWISMALILWVAGRFSHALAVALCHGHTRQGLAAVAGARRGRAGRYL